MPKTFCGLCSLDGDLGELIGSGENDVALLVELVLIGDVYGAVAHAEHLIAAGQDEAGTDKVRALLGLDELECGADGIGGGVGCSAEQSIGLAHLDEHGAEVVALESAARASSAVTLPRRSSTIFSTIASISIGQRIDYLKTLDIEAALCSRCLDLIDVADENRSQEAVLLEPCCGLENARIAAFGIDDLAGIGFKVSLSDFQTWLIPPECLFLHTNTVPLLAAVFKIFAAISIYKGIFYLYNILTVINFKVKQCREAFLRRSRRCAGTRT